MKVSHHAYLVKLPEVNPEIALTLYEPEANLEVVVIELASIGITEVRNLTTQASLRPTKGEYRLLLICTLAISFEAQQALLKILEEPPASTRFLFVLPEKVVLLPTLLSRFFDLTPAAIFNLEPPLSFINFLKADYATRIQEISSRTTKKDVQWTDEIQLGLKVYLANIDKLKVASLNSLAYILSKLGTRGASNKMLLEELALSLPVGAQK